MTARELINHHVRHSWLWMAAGFGLIGLTLAITVAAAVRHKPPVPWWIPSIWLIGMIGGAGFMAWSNHHRQQTAPLPVVPGRP